MITNSGRKRIIKYSLWIKRYRSRFRLLVVGLGLSLIFLFHFLSKEEYVTYITKVPPNNLKQPILMPHSDKSQKVKYPDNDGLRANATMLTLARNSDLWSLVESIRHVEDRFNRKYGYDWVFLNDEPFTEEFKKLTTALVSGKTKYGLIPKEHWSVPDWIDEKKATDARNKMIENDIPYADSIPYRHMCRFESGFFWRQDILNEYKWYWRIEPDIKIYCDINYDVFKFMELNNKTYGFILSLSEYDKTIPTLWNTTRNFIENHPEYISKNNLMKFISDDEGKTYNLCHFWSNFEIASLDFWRSDAYRNYFEYLDKSGGFFYERWGDAPIHSIAASLFLDKTKLHFFDGIGYYHPTFFSCPVEEAIRLQNQCICDPKEDHTWYQYYFCTRKYFKVQKLKLPPGVKPNKN